MRVLLIVYIAGLVACGQSAPAIEDPASPEDAGTSMDAQTTPDTPDSDNPPERVADAGEADADTDEPVDIDAGAPPDDGPRAYTIFSLNVHDWVFAESSIETVGRVIDIHEAHDVPINIFVIDAVFQNYVEMAPELVERLRTSDVVTMAHHYRPPYPFYSGFDHLGLTRMDDETLYETLLAYTEQRIDLATGNVLDEPGGYQFIADTLGTPPAMVSIPTGGRVAETLAGILLAKGATLLAVHDDVDLGDMMYGLYTRPENIDYKLYERASRGIDGEEAFAEALADRPAEGDYFIGMKYHENNFYVVGTPFWPVYWEDMDKTMPLSPPYDLEASDGVIEHRSEEQQAQHWTLYESTVAYAAEHRSEVNPLSAADLLELIRTTSE